VLVAFATPATLFAAPAVTTAIVCEVAASGTSHNRAGAEVSRTCSHAVPAAIESSGRSGTAATAHGHTTAAMTAAAATHGHTTTTTASALTFS
jgi:hypothetical protein